jgi:hypothetical protein
VPQGQASRLLIAGVAMLVVSVLGTVAYFTVGSSNDRGPLAARGAVGAADASDPSRPAPAPATSTTAAPPAEVACRDLDPSSWQAADTEAGLLAAVRTGDVPDLIEPDRPLGAPTRREEVRGVEAYLAAQGPEGAGQRQALEAAGFEAASIGTYRRRYDGAVQVLAFRDQASALAFAADQLGALCGSLGDPAVRPLADGFSYVDGNGLVTTTFALGRHLVTLGICGCAPDEGIDLLDAWHQGWIEQFAA